MLALKNSSAHISFQNLDDLLHLSSNNFIESINNFSIKKFVNANQTDFVDDKKSLEKLVQLKKRLINITAGNLPMKNKTLDTINEVINDLITLSDGDEEEEIKTSRTFSDSKNYKEKLESIIKLNKEEWQNEINTLNLKKIINKNTSLLFDNDKSLKLKLMALQKRLGKEPSSHAENQQTVLNSVVRAINIFTYQSDDESVEQCLSQSSSQNQLLLTTSIIDLSSSGQIVPNETMPIAEPKKLAEAKDVKQIITSPALEEIKKQSLVESKKYIEGTVVQLPGELDNLPTFGKTAEEEVEEAIKQQLEFVNLTKYQDITEPLLKKLFDDDTFLKAVYTNNESFTLSETFWDSIPPCFWLDNPVKKEGRVYNHMTFNSISYPDPLVGNTEEAIEQAITQQLEKVNLIYCPDLNDMQLARLFEMNKAMKALYIKSMKITTIPEGECSLKELHCAYCPKLNNIKNKCLKEVEILDCSYCISLLNMPELPCVEFINIQNCPKMRAEAFKMNRSFPQLKSCLEHNNQEHIDFEKNRWANSQINPQSPADTENSILTSIQDQINLMYNPHSMEEITPAPREKMGKYGEEIVDVYLNKHEQKELTKQLELQMFGKDQLRKSFVREIQQKILSSQLKSTDPLFHDIKASGILYFAPNEILIKYSNHKLSPNLYKELIAYRSKNPKKYERDGYITSEIFEKAVEEHFSKIRETIDNKKQLIKQQEEAEYKQRQMEIQLENARLLENKQRKLDLEKQRKINEERRLEEERQRKIYEERRLEEERQRKTRAEKPGSLNATGQYYNKFSRHYYANDKNKKK